MNTQNTFDKEQFQNTLVSLRKERGLTQAALAETLGVSDKTYSKWETGENEPSLTAISRLAEYYGVSSDIFLGTNARRNRLDMEEIIYETIDALPQEDAVQKSFELQFYAIRGLARYSFLPQNEKLASSQSTDAEQTVTQPAHSVVTPPPNRVNHSNGITAYADTDAYTMMYNGTDANIALSLMPTEDNYDWLVSERDKLSNYLSLLGDPDMLRCLPHMLDRTFSNRFSSEYLAKHADVSTDKVTELLNRAVSLGICTKTTAHLGSHTVDLYSVWADFMLLGILVLTHLSLPGAHKNGRAYSYSPCKITFAGSVNPQKEV